MKVIFLAFANSSTDPLSYLGEEDTGLYEMLSERAFIGDYFIHKESFATPEIISKFLDKYRDDLAIFHFSGHAGSKQLLVNGQPMYAAGIASQLEYSAGKGNLKLVVLNGCSTKGQVNLLKSKGVPAIISTSAPVNDQRAKEFSLRFWQKLVKEEKTIAEAYKDAIGIAKGYKDEEIGSERHIYTEDTPYPDDKDAPLWEMGCINEADVDICPVPYRDKQADKLPRPNIELVRILYNSFKEAGNPKIVDLWEKENRVVNPENVTESTKQINIVNSIPFPVGIHLQKLICPMAGTDDQGYDVFGINRLKQIVQFFQITTEFLCIIMIAQVWELFVRYPNDFSLNDELKKKLKEYLEIDGTSREVYDFIPLIQAIRRYLEDFTPANQELKSFIDEQQILKDMFLFDENFRGACYYLADIRNRTINKKIAEDRVETICYEAERQLCIFVKPLGFIHRYQLTSIQNIDILKLRHIAKSETEYKHRIMKCMQAIGADEQSYYYMNTFLDNWGVILLKCETTRISPGKYKVKVIDYLNLTPFVIDWNAFIDKADLIDIMFFKAETDNGICFQRVKQPMNKRDAQLVSKTEPEQDDNLDPIRMQFDAFKKFIA